MIRHAQDPSLRSGWQYENASKWPERSVGNDCSEAEGILRDARSAPRQCKACGVKRRIFSLTGRQAVKIRHSRALVQNDKPERLHHDALRSSWVKRRIFSLTGRQAVKIRHSRALIQNNRSVVKFYVIDFYVCNVCEISVKTCDTKLYKLQANIFRMMFI